MKDGQILECNGEHEHYSKTTPDRVCCPDICTPVIRECKCPPLNMPSCQCNSGYNRNATTGKCVACLVTG